MIIKELGIKGCFQIFFKPNNDNRGYFSRTYCKKEFKKFGINDKWVQSNISLNKKKILLEDYTFKLNHLKKTS